MTEKQKHTVYDLASGVVFQLADCIPFVEPGQDWHPGFWPASKYRFVDGEPVPYSAPPEPSELVLARARDAALASTYEAMRALRLRYVTDLPGQDMLYETKRREAEAFLADPDPDLTQYSLLGSEVAAGRVQSHYQSAQVVLGLGAQWRQLAAAMDALRYQTDDAIAAAASVEQIEAIRAAFEVALVQFP